MQDTSIDPGSGVALEVAKGQALTVELPDGRQVVDLNAFSSENPAERFSASATRMRHGAHVTAGHELLSCWPWERPMLKIVHDSLAERLGGAVRDEKGCAPHDLLYPPCSRPYRRRVYGTDTDGCHENLAAAVAPFGIRSEWVHDALNLFMQTGIAPDDRLQFATPVAERGDRVVLRAEMNCIVALSVCPSGSSGGVPHAVAAHVGPHGGAHR
jgi:uncharacterized protein